MRRLYLQIYLSFSFQIEQLFTSEPGPIGRFFKGPDIVLSSLNRAQVKFDRLGLHRLCKGGYTRFLDFLDGLIFKVRDAVLEGCF